VDEDTLMDFEYAVGKPPTTDKSLTLNTRSPTAKILLSYRLDTPNVRHPLSPGTAPAGGSPTRVPPSLPLGQAESCNLYNGTSEAEFGESVEKRENKRAEHSGAEETKNMYEYIEKELIELKGQLKELVKAEKAATQED